ncbi:MAG TPA: CPBP family intramembrane glutamic endopeptidase [Gaiellaceae bacterium]|nr:CPBP family intramembrane glutamic endopeptidase [Gaiellaceae bacterium]
MTRGRLVAWLTLVGALIALGYYGRAAGGKPDRDVLYQWGTAASSAVSYLIMLGFVLWIAGGRRDVLALRRPRSLGQAAALGIGVLIGIFVLGALLNPILHAGREQGLTPTHWEPRHAGAYAANFAVVAVVAPVVEELTYRGLGFTLLVPFGAVAAIALTAVLFGLSHGLVEALPVLTAFGIGLAWIRHRTDSSYPAMVVHGCFNALALILAVTT